MLLLSLSVSLLRVRNITAQFCALASESLLPKCKYLQFLRSRSFHSAVAWLVLKASETLGFYIASLVDAIGNAEVSSSVLYVIYMYIHRHTIKLRLNVILLENPYKLFTE